MTTKTTQTISDSCEQQIHSDLNGNLQILISSEIKYQQVDSGLQQGRAAFGMVTIGPQQLPCLRGSSDILASLWQNVFLECPESAPKDGHFCNSPGIQVKQI